MFCSSKIKIFLSFGILLLLHSASGNNIVESYTKEMLRRIEQQLADFKVKHDEAIHRIDEFKSDEACFNVTVEHFEYKNDSDPFGNFNLGQIKTSLSTLIEMRDKFGGTELKTNQPCDCDATQQTKLNTEMQTNIIQQLNKSSTELNQFLINKITELSNTSTDKKIQATEGIRNQLESFKTTVQHQINQITATTQESSNKTNQLLNESNAIKANLDNQIRAYSTSQNEITKKLNDETNSVKAILEDIKNDFKTHIKTQYNEQTIHLKSCTDAIATGNGAGLYRILISDEVASVYCDESGKMMIQRQIEGPIGFFNRTWFAFKEGFGHPSGQYWMGLQKMHKLTTANHYELHMSVTDFDNVTYYLKYDDFQIGNEEEKFKITEIGNFTSNENVDILRNHVNLSFSTFDNNNDVYADTCPQDYLSGWWYQNCHTINLNLPVQRNEDEKIQLVLNWSTDKALKEASMFIKLK